MIVEISVVPIGVGESLSSYITEAVKVLREKGIKYDITPMGTVIEIETFPELGELLEDIRKKLESMGVSRIYFSVKVDWRKKATDMEYKVKSVKSKLDIS